MKKPLPGQKSKKRYRLLKPSRLAPALLLAAGILCCCAALPNPRQRSGSGVGGSAACSKNARFDSSLNLDSGADYNGSCSLGSVAGDGCSLVNSVRDNSRSNAGCQGDSNGSNGSTGSTGNGTFNDAGAGSDNSKSPGVFYDIVDFRKERMALPERHELFYLAARGPAKFWGNVPEIKKHGDSGSLLKSFGHSLTYIGGADGFFDIPGKMLRADPLPNQYRLIQNRAFDLNADGFPEQYTLRNGKVTVRADSHIVWQSPEDWWVDYSFLGDADNDGKPELCLLLWKEGSFGPYKPFWLEKDDCSVKNHLFIYRLEKDTFKPVWHSSNLDCPNYLAALVDLNGNGENELLVVEGSYSDPERKELTRWKWNGWGFSRVD